MFHLKHTLSRSIWISKMNLNVESREAYTIAHVYISKQD